MQTIAFGDVRAWCESLCARLDCGFETPLFGADTARLAHEMI